MKTALSLAVLVAALAPRVVIGHATEVRHCVTMDNKLRIFIQHWHGELGSTPGSSDTMNLQDNAEGGALVTASPTGHINNVQDISTGLPGCEHTISDALSKCHNQNHDDWVWYDFPASLVGNVSYTVLSGNSALFEEGCTELLPVTITGVLKPPSQEQVALQTGWDPEGDVPIEEHVFAVKVNKTLDFWNDPDARLKATPLEMRTFVLPPFNDTLPDQESNGRWLAETAPLTTLATGDTTTDVVATGNVATTDGLYELRLPDRLPPKVSNGRWVKDTKDDPWASKLGSNQGRMAEATGRLLFTFGDNSCSCSASAVRDYQSTDRSLIVTAAHCIYDEKNKLWATNVLFIPNQDDGTDDGISNRNCNDDAYGCFIPTFAVVDSEWASNVNDVVHDFGFLVVKNTGAHAGPGGRDLALEETVNPLDIDWTDKAQMEAGKTVYNMGLPGVWSNQLRYAKGSLMIDKNLQFVKGCTLVEGASGGPMPADPFAAVPMLFSINSFKSGYFDDDGEFVQTSCGGPLLRGNSYCKLLEVAETLAFNSPEASVDGGIIVPYDKDGGCNMPGWCESHSDCDDGLFCNGVETCLNNACQPGADVCDGYRCDDTIDECLPPCLSDAECDNGIFCDGVEACVSGKCIAGLGNPCVDGEMCEPFQDKCVQAECTSDLSCNDGLHCNGKEMCIEGMCQEGVLPCDPDERCDEVTQMCADPTCWLLENEITCQNDVDNDCCVCLEWCGPQDNSIVECGAWLFFPNHMHYDFDQKDEWGLDYTPEYYEYVDSHQDIFAEDYHEMMNQTFADVAWSDLGHTNRTETRVPVFPTCLIWTLFMDEKAPTRFTEIHGDGSSNLLPGRDQGGSHLRGRRD